MSQELPGIIQTIGVLAAVYATFTAYRARDNQKTATLTQMQSDIRTLSARMRALETAICRAYARRAKGAPPAQAHNETRGANCEPNNAERRAGEAQSKRRSA